MTAASKLQPTVKLQKEFAAWQSDCRLTTEDKGLANTATIQTEGARL